MNALDFLAPIIAKAKEVIPEEDGDYLDDEGFLCCGKCRTRKQCLVTMPDLSGEGHPPQEVKVPVMCQCRIEAQRAEEEEERRRKEMEVVQKLKKESLMDDQIRDATFDTFQQTTQNARNLKLCRRYAEHFAEMLERNQGLLFYGDVGTGKTFAAACIANYLLARRTSVVMTSFVKLLNSMQSFKDDDEKLISRLNQAKLLIIDDLGAERGSDFTLEKVYNIIDSRYRARKPVILTTNLGLKEMKETTDIRYSRIYDRIFEVCYPMQFTGKSWRKAEAARRFDEMRDFLEGDNG